MRPSSTPTLLLLPGLACDGELFAGLLPALHGLALDVRVADVHMRCDTLAGMAAALLAEHPSGPLVLVGVSMGGMLALEVQRQAPRRIAALALLGSTARADTPELVALRSQACALFAEGRMAEVLRANVAFAFHPANQGNAALVQRYLAMVGRAGAGQLIRQNRAVMARIDSRPLLHAIGCPLLLACGEADLLTPLQHAEEIAAAVPQAELHVVPGAGHMLTMEQPAAVGGLLRRWLQRGPNTSGAVTTTSSG